MPALDKLSQLLSLARFAQQSHEQGLIDESRKTDMERTQQLIEKGRGEAEQFERDRTLTSQVESLAGLPPSEASDVERMMLHSLVQRGVTSGALTPERGRFATEGLPLGMLGRDPEGRVALTLQMLDAGVMSPMNVSPEIKAIWNIKQRSEKKLPDDLAAEMFPVSPSDAMTAERGRTEDQVAVLEGKRKQQIMELSPQIQSFEDLMNPQMVPPYLRADIAKATGLEPELKAMDDAKTDKAKRQRESQRFGFLADPEARGTANELQDYMDRELKRLQPGGDPLLWEQVDQKEKDRRIEAKENKESDFKPLSNMTALATGQPAIFAVKRAGMDQTFQNVESRIVKLDNELQNIMDFGQSVSSSRNEADSVQAVQEREELERRRALGAP